VFAIDALIAGRIPDDPPFSFLLLFSRVRLVKNVSWAKEPLQPLGIAGEHCGPSIARTGRAP